MSFELFYQLHLLFPGDSWWLLPPMWNRIALSIFLLQFCFKNFKKMSSPASLPSATKGPSGTVWWSKVVIDSVPDTGPAAQSKPSIHLPLKPRHQDIPEFCQLLPCKSGVLEKSYMSLTIHKKIWVEGKSAQVWSPSPRCEEEPRWTNNSLLNGLQRKWAQIESKFR